MIFFVSSCLTVIDGHIDLYTGLNADAGNLLHNVTRGMQINKPLVNAHLKAIPSVGTLTTRGLTGSDLQLLCGKTDGATDVELLVHGSLLQISADLLNVLDIAGGEGDTDAVYLGTSVLKSSFLLSGGYVGGHFEFYV